MSFRTSEWVSVGHPDKVADSISEYILDKLIELDPHVRYALEVQIKGEWVTLGGEITTSADVVEGDYQTWAREAVAKIGYTKEYQNKWGKNNTICDKDLMVVCNISQQSSDISQGVDSCGWGDQGIFYGYAENNPSTLYMPKDWFLARQLGQFLYYNSFSENVGGLDIKTQITLKNEKIYKVIVAIPVLTEFELEEIKSSVEYWLEVVQQTSCENIIINGTGIYQKHGPIADCGTTGRKLAVDFYGGNSVIGGGSPWTKDSTKADLTLNMYARDIALQKMKYLNEINNEIFCVKTALSCCIGKETVLVSIKWYDNKENLLGEEHYEERIKPFVLTEKYLLNTPKYFNMCKEGLFKGISRNDL